MQRLLYYMCLVLILVSGSGCKKPPVYNGQGTSIVVNPSVISARPGDTINFKVMMRDSSALMDYGANVTLEGGYSTGLASMQLYNRIVTLTQGYRVPANFIGQIVIEFIATTGSAQISAFGTINVSSPTPTFNTYDSVAIGNYKNTAVGCFFSSVTGKVYSQALAASNQNRIDMGFFIGIHTLATLAAPADASFGTGPNQIDYGTENWNILHRTNFKSVYAPDFTAIKSGYDIE